MIEPLKPSAEAWACFDRDGSLALLRYLRAVQTWMDDAWVIAGAEVE
jgi:hypothetical protein